MSSITNLSKLTNGKTHLITGENVYGQKGKGGMAQLTSAPQPEVERIGQQWYDRQQPAPPLTPPGNWAKSGRYAPASICPPKASPP